MVNGFYAAYYTGEVGIGFAVLVLTDGTIMGADATGGMYDGSYTEKDDGSSISGKISVVVPAGTILVTGAPPQAQPYKFEFPINLSMDAVEKGQVVPLQLPTGSINVTIKRLRSM